jgi:hypothetical protein
MKYTNKNVFDVNMILEFNKILKGSHHATKTGSSKFLPRFRTL